MNIFHTKIRCNRINAKCCKIMDFIAQNIINLAPCDIINKTLHHSPTTNERSINDLQNDTRHSNIQYTATSNLFFCSLPLSLSFTVRLLPLFIIVCGVCIQTKRCARENHAPHCAFWLTINLHFQHNFVILSVICCYVVAVFAVVPLGTIERLHVRDRLFTMWLPIHNQTIYWCWCLVPAMLSCAANAGLQPIIQCVSERATCNPWQ